MSATNRHGLARSAHDYYETPPHALQDLAEELGIKSNSEGYLLDAGSGNGAIGAYFAREFPRIEVEGIELQQELVDVARARHVYNAAFNQGDFLHAECTIPKHLLEWVIMNPPYNAEEGTALQFLKRALCMGHEGTQVAALLRVGFFEASPDKPLGKERQEFLAANPFDLLLCQRRPSFNGAGTDGTSYAWYIFGEGRGNFFRIQKSVGSKCK